MKRIIFYCFVISLSIHDLRAQSFSFSQDPFVFFIGAFNDSVKCGYDSFSGSAVILAPSSTFPTGFSLSSRTTNITPANSPGDVIIYYPSGQRGTKSLELRANDSSGNAEDKTTIYFIPETKKKDYVHFGPNNPDFIIEDKDGLLTKDNVIITVSDTFPYNTKFTLRILYAQSDFPGIKSASSKSVDYEVGDSPNIVLPISILGSNSVKDDRKIVFEVVDSNGNVWATDTLEVKSQENEKRVKNLKAYLSVGGSFDFLKDSDRPLSAFSEIYVRSNNFGLKSAQGQNKLLGKGRAINHWSISGHYYSATVVSTRDTLERYSEHIPFDMRDKDTVSLVRGFGKQVRINSSNFYTLAGRINYNLIPRLAEEHQILAYLNFEGLIRKSSQQYENFGTPAYDSTEYAVVDLPKDIARYSYSDLTLKSNQYDKTRFEGYGGLGLRYEWENDEIQLMVDAGVGIAFYDLRFYTQAGFPNMSSVYYNNEFSLVVKSIGVKFGGDIRSKINPGNSSNTDRWKPLGMIYLSKTFSVDKLKDFVKSI